MSNAVTSAVRIAVDNVDEQFRQYPAENLYGEILRSKESKFPLIFGPVAQQEAYGLKEWNAKYIKLGDLKDPDFADALWRASPKSRSKQMQEAICDPKDRCVPRDYQSVKGGISFNVDADPPSLRAILIHPDLVSEKLLEDLGLADFSALKGQPEEKLKLRCSPDVINGLKLALENAQSLETGNHRILILKPNALTGQYGESTKVLPMELAGKLLITREVEVTVEGYRRLTLQFLPDPHSAMRSRLHIKSGYAGERKEINTIRADVRFMQHRLDKEWAGMDPAQKDGLKAEVADTLTQCIALLETARDRYKTQANKFLSLAAPLQDKNLKDNPTVALTRITAALDRLDKRLKEIHGKGGKVESDYVSLIDEMDLSAALLRKYRRSVVEAAQAMQVGPIQVPPHPSVLEPSRLSPYRTIVNALEIQHSMLTEALSADQVAEAQKGLVRMYFVLKLHAAYEVFEEVKTKALQVQLGLRRGSTEELSDLKKLLDKYADFFETRQILPDVDIEPEFQAVFDFYCQKLRTVKESFDQTEAAQDPEDVINNLVQFIRDNFNVNETLLKLPFCKQPNSPKLA